MNKGCPRRRFQNGSMRLARLDESGKISRKTSIVEKKQRRACEW
jgi:hypothetical protein